MPEIREIDDKVTELRFPDAPQPLLAMTAEVVYCDDLVILTRMTTQYGGRVCYQHMLTEFPCPA